MSFAQSRLKKRINKRGVIDSNSVIFHFIIPSLFAALFSAILQGVNKSDATFTATNVVNVTTSTFNTTLIANRPYVGWGRNSAIQGIYQLAGWGISVGIGAISGLIIGCIYRLLNDSF